MDEDEKKENKRLSVYAKNEFLDRIKALSIDCYQERPEPHPYISADGPPFKIEKDFFIKEKEFNEEKLIIFVQASSYQVAKLYHSLSRPKFILSGITVEYYGLQKGKGYVGRVYMLVTANEEQVDTIKRVMYNSQASDEQVAFSIDWDSVTKMII